MAAVLGMVGDTGMAGVGAAEGLAAVLTTAVGVGAATGHIITVGGADKIEC